MDCIGVDLFVVYDGIPPMPKEVGPLKLQLISNRGTSMPLDGSEPGFMLVDWHRCRYVADSPIQEGDIHKLLKECEGVGYWEKAQKLFQKDGKNLFSKAHGK